jgi:Uma2 family endonuclease
LDEQQLGTFQGAPFFAVEADDLSMSPKLNTLTSKFMDTYFPAGVQLGWLIDPINKIIYTFMRESDGVVRRRPHQWYDSDENPGVLNGGDVLPGFTLRLETIDQLLSQV